MFQCNIAHAFLDYNMEADDDSPDPEGESCCKTVCTAGLSTDKDIWGLLAYSLLGSKGSAGSQGRTDSELKCSQPPKIGIL